ncbi:MAG TPA: hypothetical protein PKK26_07025 [Candidatus Wallbacteria bacterium]|nr:hypothetical protein [Candidatus Wallbacteria bacterium]
MTENNDLEKKLGSAFSDQASKDSLLNVNEIKAAQYKKIIARPNYLPYAIILALVSIIIFTAFESATMPQAIRSAGDPSMTDVSYARDNFTNSLYSAFQSGRMSVIFIFLLFEGFALYVGFLILESLLMLVISVFRSKEAKNIKMFF